MEMERGGRRLRLPLPELTGFGVEADEKCLLQEASGSHSLHVSACTMTVPSAHADGDQGTTIVFLIRHRKLAV
jgi:hypothetical protein